MTRILIADDHEMVRRGLRDLLEGHPDWTICGEAVTGTGAVAQAKELKPDVAVLDFAMPELNGLEATRQIRQVSPHTEILMLTPSATATCLLVLPSVRSWTISRSRAVRRGGFRDSARTGCPGLR